MPGGVEHAVTMRNPVEMRTLYIEPNAHRRLPQSCVSITPSSLLKELIDALLEEPESYAQSDRGISNGKLILEEVCHGKALKLSIPMPSDPSLLRVCEHVIDNPRESASLVDYSELAIASERTLARICQRELEMSFAEWRQQVRFHHALENLARGKNVGEVARDCGYASASNFTVAFRKNFGLPPSRLLASAVDGRGE